MNAIPYFDYSLAPFWPSYQNKIIGVLERALREQSGSRIRRILLRLPCEYDRTFSSRKIWFGMDFIETVSALMNATPGRDLCWLLTRHPEKPEYHVVLCVRQEYFDGPELDRLILDAWSNVLGFASPGEAKQYQKQITRDVVLDSRSPDCENILKELIWAFSDFARDRRGVCDPEAVASPVIPAIPDLQDRSESSVQHLSLHSHKLHKSHKGHSDHVDHNKPRQRVTACRRSPDRHELHHQFHRYDR